MKKYFLFTVILLIVVVGLAHEFWLQPVKFLLRIGENTAVNVYVGEGFKGEKADGTKYKIRLLKHFSAAAEEDFQNKVSPSDLSSIKASFKTAGNHLLAFNNSNKQLSLAAIEFNAYLREEGLDDILQQRIAANDTLKDGREVYQRCVKTLFQVGSKNDDTYKTNTGMRLELIPASNPYLIKNTDSLTFTVLFDNKPVSNALLLAWNVVQEKTTVHKYRTDQQGSVRFPVSRAGRWMISSVKMIAAENKQEADWQSFWGSYTFGFY